MRSGIYKIINKVNGKFYIGSSKDVDDRWVCHKRDLRSGQHINPKLQHAWTFYGENAFVFSVVEIVQSKPTLLFERENHYLSTLKPYERKVGYNICPTAEGGDNITHNPNRNKFIKKMLVINKGKGNGMFGKTHSIKTIDDMKKKSFGRYTLDWFVKRYGKEGEKEYQKRRLALSNRSPIINSPTEKFHFKGKKHSKKYYKRRKHTEEYFKEHWTNFVEVVKSGKYSQRQLSTTLNISRPTLKKRMKQVLRQ